MTGPDAADALRANVDAARTVLAGLVDLTEPLAGAARMIAGALTGGRKMLCCGNGGSAADCAHLTTEIAARFKLQRRGFPAIDLTANHSLVTALINDFPPQEVFARQVHALGAPGDVLVALSTSGASANIRNALVAAGERGVDTIALLGRDGGACRGLATIELIVPADSTARVQEAHLVLYHTICELIDPLLARGQ